MRSALSALFIGIAALGCGSASAPLVETPAQARNADGVKRLERGDLDMAEDAFQAALREAELVDDLLREAEAYSNLGTVATARGDQSRASWCFVRALSLYVQSPTRVRGEVSARVNLGSALLELGRVSDATAQFEHASRLAAQVNDERGVLLAQVGLASVKLRSGDPASAGRLAADSRGRAESAGERTIVGAALGVEAGALEVRGDLARAEQVYEQALAIDRELGNPIGVLGDLRGLGRVAVRRADPGRAALLLARAARVEKNLGRFDEADADLAKAATLAQGALREDERASLVAERDALRKAREQQKVEPTRGK
jgi:tetratricopeptide (TPR) repeat protein